MAIPVTTDFYAAQVVVPSQTSLPEDGATNTFYFRNDGLFTQGIMADAIEVALQDFYFTVLPSGTTVGKLLLVWHRQEQLASAGVRPRPASASRAHPARHRGQRRRIQPAAN
jgi:hypothetical protein